MGAWGFGLRVEGLGSFGFRVWVLGFRHREMQNFGFRDRGLVPRAST